MGVIRRNELEGYAGQGLISLHVAFSRPAEGQKANVQDRIIAIQDEGWRLLQDGAAIYVCVDASKLAPAVRRAFDSVYCAETGSTEAAADSWLADLDAAGRYIADVSAARRPARCPILWWPSRYDPWDRGYGRAGMGNSALKAAMLFLCG